MARGGRPPRRGGLKDYYYEFIKLNQKHIRGGLDYSPQPPRDAWLRFRLAIWIRMQQEMEQKNLGQKGPCFRLPIDYYIDKTLSGEIRLEAPIVQGRTLEQRRQLDNFLVDQGILLPLPCIYPRLARTAEKWRQAGAF